MAWVNLDFECEQLARKAANEIRTAKPDPEKLVQELGSVLARQGPTAMGLHLAQKGRKKPNDDKKAADLLAGRVAEVVAKVETVCGTGGWTAPAPLAGLQWREGHVRLDKRLEWAAKDLTRLLAARKLLNQFFTYLRYELRVEP